ILVGASDYKEHHNRTWFSNYGSRVDCFAWGRYVATTGTIRGVGDLSGGGGGPEQTDTQHFYGPNPSPTINAGTAIHLQGMAKANCGVLISPVQMRTYLANRATGTPQGPGIAGDYYPCGLPTTGPGNIGVMPDLKAIINANPVFRPMPMPCQTSRVRCR